MKIIRNIAENVNFLLAKSTHFCYYTYVMDFLSDPMNIKEVESWLNVRFVRKLLTLVMESAIPIEDPTKSGMRM